MATRTRVPGAGWTGRRTRGSTFRSRAWRFT